MPLLDVKQLDKRFGMQYALSGVSLEVKPGEVHALVGENGAGKSTLIKILTGVYSPDGGSMKWLGQPVSLASPRHARDLGIRVIHQERQLVPAFTALENLYLGAEYPRNAWGAIRWKRMREKAKTLQKELGVEFPLDIPACDMSPPERTLVEIARAMMTDCRLLILDEPTAALTDQETAALFRMIERLKAQGTAMIYVSHRMDEVFRLSDRITVLRNGKVAGTLNRDEADRGRLIRLMTDQEIGRIRRRERNRKPGARPVLEIEGVRTFDGKVRSATLSVREGEIAGLFGLAGAGRTELLESLYGIRKSAGTIRLLGSPVRRPSPQFALEHGMVLIPEDRRAHAVLAGMSVRENMTLPVLSRYSGILRVNFRQERSEAGHWMNALNIKADHLEQPVGELSGGNQQKVVFAKALLSNPRLFLCDEPTQAVDVMTRAEIHRILGEQAERGCGVLYVSSDLQELLEIADRLYVMSEGEIVAELANDGLTPEEVLQHCYHHGKGSEPSNESAK
jgi:ribose transport system ATP-binding protein